MVILAIKIWGLVNFVFFLGLGLATCLFYQKIVPYTYYVVNTPQAIAEFKAIYGGFMIAYALILAVLYYYQAWRLLIIVLTLSYFGFGAGRLLGVITNNATDSHTLLYFSIEVVSSLIGLILFSLQLRAE